MPRADVTEKITGVSPKGKKILVVGAGGIGCELVKNLDSTSAQLDASDRASRERIESAAALLEKQAEMLRRKSMEQLDEQIRQYEAKVAKGERGDTPSKLASLKREMSVVQSSGKAVSSGFCRFLQCLP